MQDQIELFIGGIMYILYKNKFFSQWFCKQNYDCTSLFNIMSVALLYTLHSELEPLLPLL